MASVRRASKLENRDLIVAALQRAERDDRLAALRHPLFDTVHNGANAPLEVGSQRGFMCPDLYQATVSGSINRVNGLLGLIEETTRIPNEGHDVAVLMEDTSGKNMSSRQWGCRLHGDSLCTLQEVTAEKNTVLHIAAEQGHVQLVEQIITRDNILLLSQNSRHETPLHLAARAGNCRIVCLIIFLAQEYGIGAYEVLTKRSIEGDTVLHEATRHGHQDVVEVLMTVAPALSIELNNASMSPLYLAVLRKSIGIVGTMQQYSYSSVVGPNQQNALHAAVLQCPEITSMLIDWKAELANKRDASGSTPIHYAASIGDVPIIKSILDRAPLAVYIQDQEGSSPLHVAARMRHYSAVSCFIDHCPDSFEIRDNHGRNFLHIVAQHGGRDMNLNRQDLKNIISIINLVSQKPDLRKLVNERDNDGNTPLHFASLNGFSEVILHFVKVSEADTTLMNNEGKTALDHAASLKSFSLMAGAVVTLFAYGATFSPRRQDKVLKEGKDQTTKWIDKVSKNLIIVSVLIATIAFSAAFNVPGSYNGDGRANLRYNSKYSIFVVLDTTAMSTSVGATMLLVVAKAGSNRSSWTCFILSLYFLWTSLFTMQLAFIIAVSVPLGYGYLANKFIIAGISIFFFACTVYTIRRTGSPAEFGTIRKFISSTKEQKQTTRQIAIQFPMLDFYVRISKLFFFLHLFFYIVFVAILSA